MNGGKISFLKEEREAGDKVEARGRTRRAAGRVERACFSTCSSGRSFKPRGPDRLAPNDARARHDGERGYHLIDR
jgi:hypothetical protein